jgi:hypothetical protein
MLPPAATASAFAGGRAYRSLSAPGLVPGAFFFEIPMKLFSARKRSWTIALAAISRIAGAVFKPRV